MTVSIPSPGRNRASRRSSETASPKRMKRPPLHVPIALRPSSVIVRKLAQPAITSPGVDEDARRTLEETTRYDPSEVERRIYERWENSGAFSPEPKGESSENFSI